MPEYCFLASVIASDAKAGLRAAAAAIRGYAVARRNEGTLPSDDPDYFVLSLNGTAVTIPRNTAHGAVQEEVVLHIIIGYNQNVSQNVATEIGNLQVAGGSQIAFNPPLTRAQIIARLHQRAGEDGCDAIWDVKGGDDLTTGVNAAADLLAKFTSLS